MSPTLRVVVAASLPSLVSACGQPECSPPDYSLAECRVVAENLSARLVAAGGVEVRFQDPTSDDTESWAATGRLHVASDGQVEGRVGTLGDLRLSVHRGDSERETLRLRLHNVHPLIELDGEVSADGLSRVIEVALDDDVVEVRGTLPEAACAGGARIAAVADIQTNPGQFQRIVEALYDEADDAAAAGTPLLGMVVLGDLSENSEQHELEEVDRLLRAAPVPAAVTPGNHDIYDGQVPVYNQVFGPGNLAFDLCDTHIVLLDTGSGDIADSVQGRLPELLESDQPHLIAGMHFPLYPSLSANAWTRQDQAQLLMAELSARDADLVLAGHLHRRIEHTLAPVKQIVVGTGGATQGVTTPDYGYLRVRLDGGPRTCFVPVPAPGLEPPRSPSLADCATR